MLTYVINTSENKTLDSNRLFELSGYNRICWMNCKLNEIEDCAEEIFQKISSVFADRFRITVLVDFFDFAKIRSPYGVGGYQDLTGVDLAVYLPFIEAYLSDHVFGYLEKKRINISDCSIIYIHSGNYEEYYQVYNEEYQLYGILTGDEETREVEPLKKGEKPVPSVEEQLAQFEKVEEPELVSADAGETIYFKTQERKDFRDLVYPADTFTSFHLYCNDGLSLRFGLDDYPYGGKSRMSFDEFYHAFSIRSECVSHIHRYHYAARHVGSPAGVAYDTLVLSLCLIHAYEREDNINIDEKSILTAVSPDALKEVLENAWRKIRAARRAAKANQSTYYALDDVLTETKPRAEALDPANIQPVYVEDKLSGDQLTFEWQFQEVLDFAANGSGKFSERERAEFNEILTEYFRKRDETCAQSVKEGVDATKGTGSYKTTDQFPSKEKYEYLVEKKKTQISATLDSALRAQAGVDYTEQKEAAQRAKKRYDTARAYLNRNIIGDVIFFILALIATIVPYGAMQLQSVEPETWGFYYFAVMVFTGIYFLAAFFHLLPVIKKLRDAKADMKDIYMECLGKHEAMFQNIRARYQKDLIAIEEATYELRELERLYNENVNKDKNIRSHRELLEDVEDRVSGILNNLGVVPTEKENEDIDGEFNMNKPFRAAENKVYRVFSLEAIESMFPESKAGGAER